MCKILIVDDNQTNVELVSRVLARTGYEILVANDGATGLLQAWTQRPDLIIMDMGMPVFDGWAATRQLKASPETRAIPILALTAHAHPQDRARCFAAGCDDYDTKPVNFRRLRSKVADLLAAPG